MVGGDVVAHLQQRFDGKAFRQGGGDGELLDVRSAQDLHAVHFLRRSGSGHHVVVDQEVFRHRHGNLSAQCAGIRQHAGQCGNSRRLGADQIDLSVCRAGAAFKVAVEGAQGYTVGIRGLAHADAGAARAFQHTGARGNDIGQCAVFREHVVHLLAAGCDSEADVGMNRLALQNRGDVHQIEVGGIGARADADLVYLDGADSFHGFHVVGAVRAGHHGDERGQIHGDLLVIYRVGIGGERRPVLLTSLRAEKFTRDFVGGEDGGGGAELRAHVGDGGALRHGQGGHALAGILHDFSHSALHGKDFKHLKNYIFGGYPGGKFARQVDAQHLRHGDVIRAAAHGNRHVKTARTHCQHADAAAGWGMAVGADQRFAGDAEALQMHLMADAVSGAGKANAVLFRHALDKAVIIRVLKAGLQSVVVNVCHTQLRFDARNAHRFKFQVSHGAGRVLCQGLVNAQAHVRADGHFPAHKMVFDDFLCNRKSHAGFLLFHK